ncbi:hypothetical protein FOL46_009425 [Perkinsus olseni]|uniref:LITAF domain-containing protein n=1 Tax=Perkinsus olseni TaxID=32597 RepID=A0A7J6L248_PEROL|nr:hypothetical protein FOL46_009425 [Perkinsus olseni]
MSYEETKPGTAQPAAASGPAMIGQPMAATPPPVAVVYMPEFGDDPVTLDCPNCKNKVVTRVEHESKCGTYICCCLLCLLFWPLFWLPFCCDSCQEAKHSCPNCGHPLGKKVFITS